MHTELLTYVLAFAEGFGLIISPCILPILPIMLAAGMDGGKNRPYGIITGFVLTFALFTLFARFIAQNIGINLDYIRHIAYFFIILFGVILISDKLSSLFNQFTVKIASIAPNNQLQQQSGFTSGIVLGFFVSLIWIPCGGPILATAIIQSAIQKTFWQSFLTFFFFALGSVLPMTIIILLGKKLIHTMQFFKKHAEIIRKLFGILIIVTALYGEFLEASTIYTPMPDAPNVTTLAAINESNQLIDGLKNPYPAPALENISDWLNSPPLTLNELRGKVVLIDFWTYSCINCIRTLPYIKMWYNKYHKDGLVIIGVHTPEFEFEKNPQNVAAAIKNFNILYPVALDNSYGTWLNFNNQYWPAHYLIDRNGNVVYTHFGEGAYAETEHNIQVLLGIFSNQEKISEEALTQETNFFSQITPETYLGAARAQNYAGQPNLVNNETSNFSYPQQLARDEWALLGKWSIQPELIQAAQNNAAIKIHFYAKKVYVVVNNDKQFFKLQVKLNNQAVGNFAGKDVKNNFIEVTRPGLYEILSFPNKQTGYLELIALQPGIKVYTFTFGS